MTTATKNRPASALKGTTIEGERLQGLYEKMLIKKVDLAEHRAERKSRLMDNQNYAAAEEKKKAARDAQKKVVTLFDQTNPDSMDTIDKLKDELEDLKGSISATAIVMISKGQKPVVEVERKGKKVQLEIKASVKFVQPSLF